MGTVIENKNIYHVLAIYFIANISATMVIMAERISALLFTPLIRQIISAAIYITIGAKYKIVISIFFPLPIVKWHVPKGHATLFFLNYIKFRRLLQSN